MSAIPNPCFKCGAQIPIEGPLGELCPACLLAEGQLAAELETLPLTAPFRDRGDPPRVLPVNDPAPEVIGPYRFLGLLGEGGMGRVYSAEQTKPIRRKVALKVVKPGMDSKEVLARFEAERQALALMDHPGIARVYDAGATPEGRPYFAMELVEGEPLTKYCDRTRLKVRDRLELFLLICEAVQHAHQKGVIHRDLKPANILVEERNGKPFPKVIDFGIAKALEANLTDGTLFTEIGQLVGTPEYMSPEQAALDPGGIDTRTDVFSLGVVLYELLVGEPPVSAKVLRRSGLEKMLEILREFEPPCPSIKLGSMEGETAAAVSACRDTGTQKLQSTLRGDLDWIVMRAIEKISSQRYQTVAGLAEDVVRFLRNEPVSAGPPSAFYRLRKFTRRNRGAVVSSASVLIALVFGLLASIWQAKIANEERARAEEATRHLLEDTGKRWLASGRKATQELRSEEGVLYLAPVFPDMPLMAGKTFGFEGYGRPSDPAIREYDRETREFWQTTHPAFLSKQSYLSEFRAAREIIDGIFEGGVTRFALDSESSSVVHSPAFELIWSSHPSPHPVPINAVGFGQQGRVFYSLSRDYGPSHLTVKRRAGLFGWDAGSGLELGYASHDQTIGFDVDPIMARLAVTTGSRWAVWSEDAWPDGDPLARGQHEAEVIALRPTTNQIALFASTGIDFFEIPGGTFKGNLPVIISNPRRVSFDSTGKRMLLLGDSGASLWTETSAGWKEIHSLSEPVVDMALNQSGERMIALFGEFSEEGEKNLRDRTVVVGWSVEESGVTELFRKELPGYSPGVIAFSNLDDEFVLALKETSTQTTQLEVREAGTGAVRRVVARRWRAGYPLEPASIAVSCETKRVAVSYDIMTGSGDEGTVEILDLESGEPILQSTGQLLPFDAQFNREGTRFSVLSPGSLAVFDAGEGTEIWRAAPQRGFSFTAAEYPSHDSELVVAESSIDPEVGDGTLICLDAETGTILRKQPKMDYIDEFVHLLDGKKQVTYNGRGAGALFWEEPFEEPSDRIPSPTTPPHLPDKAFLVDMGGVLLVVASAYDGSGIAWSEASPESVEGWNKITEDNGYLDFSVQSAARNPLSERVALGGSVFLDRGQPFTGKVEIRSYSGHLNWTQRFPEPVTAVEFTPDGSTFLAGTESGKIWVFNRIFVFVMNAHDSAIRSLRFDPSGRRLLSLAEDGSTRMWRTKPEALDRSVEQSTGGHSLNWRFTTDNEWLRCIGIPDIGIHLPTGHEGALPETLRMIDQKEPETAPIPHDLRDKKSILATLSIGTQTLEAVAGEGMLRIRNSLESGSTLAELSSSALPVGESRGNPHRVALIKQFIFSPDGRYGCILTPSGASVWEFESNRLSHPAQNPIPAEFCDFSADGSKLVLSGATMIARQTGRNFVSVWDVSRLLERKGDLAAELVHGLMKANEVETSIEWMGRQSLVSRPLVHLRPNKEHSRSGSNGAPGGTPSKALLLGRLLHEGALESAWTVWSGMGEQEKKDNLGIILRAFRFATEEERRVFLHYLDQPEIRKASPWLHERLKELETSQPTK